MNSSVAMEWKAVCKVSDVLPGTGVGVRLPAGQAALFEAIERRVDGATREPGLSQEIESVPMTSRESVEDHHRPDW